MYGDSRWDGDELWTTMGHLYKGGMWLKKKSVLQNEGHYNTAFSADGVTDLRTTWADKYNGSSSIISGVPSAADAGNYFYLPVLGVYNSGQLNHVGYIGTGFYWSSSATPSQRYGNYAYSLVFGYGYVYVSSFNRNNGFRAEALQ